MRELSFLPLVSRLTDFSTKMKMLRIIIYCGSLENSQENFYDGVYLSNVASLQYTGCSSTIKRLHRRFFEKYVPIVD